MARGNVKEMPHVSESNYHEGAALSQSLPVCVYSHELFFSPKKHFMCFTTFYPFVKIHFLQSHTGQGPVPGLVDRIQRFHRHSLISVLARN